MKALLIPRAFLLALLALACGAFAGCSSCKPGGSPGPAQSYNLKLSPGDSLKDSSVVVDVVGINQSELPKWQSYSIKDYFKPGDAVRQDAARFTAEFVPGKQNPAVLKKTDPLWDKWTKSGVQYLVVIADLPGVYKEGKVGSQDPRRQLIPCCKCYWPDKTADLEVRIQAGGVSLVTTLREGWTLPAW
jgi:hypothetical protein